MSRDTASVEELMSELLCEGSRWKSSAHLETVQILILRLIL